MRGFSIWAAAGGVMLAGACSNGAGSGHGAVERSGVGGDGGAFAGDVEGAGGTSSGGTAGSGATEDSTCGTGNRDLPPGLTTLSHDDGVAESHLKAQDFEIEVDGTAHFLAEEAVHEATRFELEHPARIHGFSVQWVNLPADMAPTAELSAGLFPDFGYNGFDFWREDPLWTGTRCKKHVEAGKFLTYVFDEPVELKHPGLVFVAHHAGDGDAPMFAFDGSRNEGCEKFDACRSSVNLPDAGNTFNGTSFSFPYDYLVRLHVEYTDDVEPSERWFQPVDGPSGRSLSWGDYDSDGWDDLFVGGRLYRNDAGVFTDVHASTGLEASGRVGTGGVFGDYNNDGCVDLLLYAYDFQRSDALFRNNCDGTFSDVTEAAGILDVQSYETCGDPANVAQPSAAAAWFDLDSDGFIDIYLANYDCGLTKFYKDNVFRNNGDGTFSDWSETRGFDARRSASRGAAPIDHDRDGDVDLFVSSYRLQSNRFFENKGDGTVKDAAAARDLLGERTMVGIESAYGHTTGAAWGDLDNDGDFDLVAANLAHPRYYHFSDKTQILLNDGAGSFENIAIPWNKPFSGSGLRFQETHSVPLLADFDQDGHLDLVISAVYDGRPTDFYWGQGDGTFVLDAYHAGITTEHGWGVHSADFDHDGDMDVFAISLFRNDVPDTGHWFQIRAVGNVKSNWYALGATVEIALGDQRMIRHVQGGSGQGGQDSPTLHFGLGDVDEVDAIRVWFPGVFEPVEYAGPFAADGRVWVLEDGATHRGWGPPNLNGRD